MIRTLLVLGGVSAGLYFGSRFFRRNRLLIADRITIPDREGNYDIDGVSFDPEARVVVGGDNKTPTPRADVASAEKLAELHSA